MAQKFTRILLLLGLLLVTTGVILTACQAEPEEIEVTRVVEVEVEVPGPEVEVPGPEVEVTRIVEVMVEPEMSDLVVPFEEMWAMSPHADASSEAFTHWDEDDPAEVPTSCAKCHSTPGYLDFIGADGTEAGVVDNAAPIGTTVTCEACHNDATLAMSSTVFPSGVEVTGLGAEARCMQCHQGRHSTVSVNESIASAGLEGPENLDTVGEDLGFSNIHYYAAAATLYGTVTMGGYEYDGKAYDGKFDHVEGYDTCDSCHDPHTLEIEYEECTSCHQDLRSPDDLIDIRMAGSLVDYDGDGNMDEGVYYEIEDMRTILYGLMQSYSASVIGSPVVYDSSSYPYFFNDLNADGEAGEDEAAFPNRYATWTPRLAKAAYNYQVSLKDPGRYAHGGKYIIQLLYDSIEDLNSAIEEPIDISMLSRIDHGHFAGSEEAFRHWDEDGFVSGSCSKCHSAAGLPLFLEQEVTINQPTSNGLNCATCHNDLTEFTVYEAGPAEFPSGAVLGFDENDAGSNLCINCHQGRASASSVDRAIGDLGPDEIGSLRFINVHYFAAGATLFGSEAAGAYEYAGQEYLGINEHVGAFNSCNECHNTHALTVEVEECTDCHENVQTEADLALIRFVDDDMPAVDYDGDGDIEEGIAGEIETMYEMLYDALVAYSATVGEQQILYSSASYPYFFNDLNANGEADADEVARANAFAEWTPRLLRGAYNYQYVAKDPGAFAHNGRYVVQILYDSIADLGGDVSAMTRP